MLTFLQVWGLKRTPNDPLLFFYVYTYLNVFVFFRITNLCAISNLPFNSGNSHSITCKMHHLLEDVKSRK